MNPRPWMILPLLALASASSAKSPPPSRNSSTESSAPTQPPEQLSQADIMGVVLGNKPDIVACVNAQQKAEPEREGRLEMSWAIRTNGTTHRVKCLTPELCDSHLARCLTKEIKTWTFPRHEREGEPTVFPFTFSGAQAGSPKHAPKASRQGPVLESLGQADIMGVVLDSKPDIVRCVSAQLKKEPGKSGKLLMSWAIRKDGTTHQVKCATPELCDSHLARCLTEEIQTWVFPRHKQEGEPTVFPFTF